MGDRCYQRCSSSHATRGLGASSIAGQALVQATMESTLPVYKLMQVYLHSLKIKTCLMNNKEQVLAAQQRAQFIGIEFDQDFQARVQNAAKIDDIANQNY